MSTVDLRSFARLAVPTPVRSALSRALLGAERGQQWAFQRWLGVSTSGNVYPSTGVAQTGRVFYEGCQWLPVRRSLSPLPVAPSDAFVDLGSGKGQALLIAGRFNFGRVLGVEIDPSLAEMASRNVEAARPKLRARAVEVVSEDARGWTVPDDVSVIFLYCPFIGEQFHETLGRIFAAYDQHPRDLFVVYCFPFEHNWLLSTGRVQVVNVQPARWPTRPWWWKTSWVIVTYRVIPKNGSSPTAGPALVARRSAGRSKAPKGTRASRVAKAAFARWSRPNDHVFWVGEPGKEKTYSSAAPLDGDTSQGLGRR